MIYLARGGLEIGKNRLTGLTEIVALPRGARFHRADMHIHSFGGSHDVHDGKMTPENIVNTASRKDSG
jgi:hypothetical protein